MPAQARTASQKLPGMHAKSLHSCNVPANLAAPAQDSANSSCLPSAPSQRVQSGIVSVMSGARDGNLDHQVRGEPETIAGSNGGPPQQSWSLGSSGQRVCSPC